MIIWNLAGILYGAIVLTLITLINFNDNPTFYNGPGPWIAAGIGFIVGIIMERTKYKPRLFFIPAWLFSLIILFILSWNKFGWITVIAIFGSIVLMRVLSKKKREKLEVELLEKANDILNNYKKTQDNLDENDKLKHLIEALIINKFVSHRLNVLQHNYKLIEELFNNYKQKLNEGEDIVIQNYLHKTRKMVSERKAGLNTHEDSIVILNIFNAILAER